MIGLEVLVLSLDGKYLLAGALAIPAALFARFISVGSVVLLLKKITGRPFTDHAVKVMTWGGLRGGRREDSVDKIPILGDIPFIGRAFKSTEQRDSYQELMIFITPTVIGLESSRQADTLDEFRQQLQDRSEVIRRWPFTGLDKEPHKEPHQELPPVPRRGPVDEDNRETEVEQQ